MIGKFKLIWSLLSVFVAFWWLCADGKLIKIHIQNLEVDCESARKDQFKALLDCFEPVSKAMVNNQILHPELYAAKDDQKYVIYENCCLEYREKNCAGEVYACYHDPINAYKDAESIEGEDCYPREQYNVKDCIRNRIYKSDQLPKGLTLQERDRQELEEEKFGALDLNSKFKGKAKAKPRKNQDYLDEDNDDDDDDDDDNDDDYYEEADEEEYYEEEEDVYKIILLPDNYWDTSGTSTAKSRERILLNILCFILILLV